MPCEFTNFISRALYVNDQYVTKPLIDLQLQPWVGTLWAPVQAVASAVTAVAAGIFAFLAGPIGALCYLCGAKNFGADLLESAKVALVSEDDKIKNTGLGAVYHLVIVGASLVNMCTLTIIAQKLNSSPKPAV